MTAYDLIVIGGGPGGYVSAIRAAQMGKKTALIEKDALGGTCLNYGCIPSKTLLKHATFIEQIKQADDWGIEIANVNIDFSKMISRKNSVIQRLQQGIAMLLKSGKIDLFQGYGEVHPGKRVMVHTDDRQIELSSKKIIVATGSRPAIPPIPGLESISYHTTDTIFDLPSIPQSLVIVGGGVIGVELANIFSSLGTKVTIVEISHRIIPTEDEQATKKLMNSLEKSGVNILLEQEVVSVEKLENKQKVYTRSTTKNRESLEITCEELLIAVGREPNVEAVEQLNLEMDGKFIKVNEHLETSELGIFAIGDVISGFQLAHVASAEGLTAVNNLDEHSKKMDYSVIPRCVYTRPQIATVGMTEDTLKAKNITYKAYTFPFSANGKALADDFADGFTKVLIDEAYGEVLGVVMVGEQVTEIIGQASAFIYLEGTVEELADMVQPHPTISETLFETANALLDKGIHSI